MKARAGFAVMFLAVASSAVAQTPQIWSASAKTTYGNCADGIIADVSEVPGRMHLKFSFLGQPYTEIDLALAPDGSGKTEFSGITGSNILEVAAGSGKRAMKTIQVSGTCQWSWTPR